MKKLLFLLSLLLSTNIVLAETICEQRYNNYLLTNDYNYSQLASECDPDSAVSDSEFVLSLDCQEKYDQLGISSSQELALITDDCPEISQILETFQFDLNSEDSPSLQSLTKRQLIKKVKKLREKNKNLKNRLQERCANN